MEDFYRKRLLYRLTPGGEAVEAGLAAFAEALARRGELQSVALEDILAHLDSLAELAAQPAPDAAKVHGLLRDLARVFESLAENAEAFMAGLARAIELQRAEAAAVMAFKARLIDEGRSWQRWYSQPATRRCARRRAPRCGVRAAGLSRRHAVRRTAHTIEPARRGRRARSSDYGAARLHPGCGSCASDDTQV